MDFTGERLLPDQQRDDDLYYEHLARYMFAAALARGRRVLDAGCGAGYGAALLASSGAHSVTAIDIAPEAVTYARQRYRHDSLCFAVGDIARLDLPEASFDLVVSFEVIEHLDEPDALVCAAARALAPDGIFIVSTPNPATYPAGNPFHKHELTADELLALVQRSFPATALFEQDYTTALSLRPSPDSNLPFQPLWQFTPAAERRPRQPDYYVALCARRAKTLQDALDMAASIMYELPADRLGERISDILTLQRLLEEKNLHLSEKDAHIADLENELKRQGAWAASLEQQVLALGRPWYRRLLDRSARRS